MDNRKKMLRLERQANITQAVKYGMALIALIALGAFIEGQTREVEQAKSKGRQEVLQEIKKECSPVYETGQKGNDWYCQGDFTDY